MPKKAGGTKNKNKKRNGTTEKTSPKATNRKRGSDGAQRQNVPLKMLGGEEISKTHQGSENPGLEWYWDSWANKKPAPGGEKEVGRRKKETKPGKIADVPQSSLCKTGPQLGKRSGRGRTKKS